MRGKDNVGATMDFMELERQRGITIQVSFFSLSAYQNPCSTTCGVRQFLKYPK